MYTNKIYSSILAIFLSLSAACSGISQKLAHLKINVDSKATLMSLSIWSYQYRSILSVLYNVIIIPIP